MTLRAPGAPRLRSRIHGPQRVHRELVRLLAKAEAALAYRAETDEERRWSARVADALERLVREGTLVLPTRVDPREARRVRKRSPGPPSLL